MMNDRPIIEGSIEDYQSQLIMAHSNFDKQEYIIKGQLHILQHENMIRPETCDLFFREIDRLHKLCLDIEIVAQKLLNEKKDKKED